MSYAQKVGGEPPSYNTLYLQQEEVAPPPYSAEPLVDEAADLILTNEGRIAYKAIATAEQNSDPSWKKYAAITLCFVSLATVFHLSTQLAPIYFLRNLSFISVPLANVGGACGLYAYRAREKNNTANKNKNTVMATKNLSKGILNGVKATSIKKNILRVANHKTNPIIKDNTKANYLFIETREIALRNYSTPYFNGYFHVAHYNGTQGEQMDVVTQHKSLTNRNEAPVQYVVFNGQVVGASDRCHLETISGKQYVVFEYEDAVSYTAPDQQIVRFEE